MGLREKALEFKQRINRDGQETLMDRIAGPAETEFVDEENSPEVDGNTSLQSEESMLPVAAENNEIGERELSVPEMEAKRESSEFKFIENEDEFFLPDEENSLEEEEMIEEESTSSEDIRLTSEDLTALPPEDETDDLFSLPDDDGEDALSRDEGTSGDIEESREHERPYNLEYREDLMGPEDDPLFPVSDENVPRNSEDTPQKIDPPPSPEPSDRDVIDSGDGYTHEIPGSETTENDEDYLFSSEEEEIIREIERDLLGSENADQVFDTFVFAVMGQVGVSSASCILPDLETEKEWRLVDSRGVTPSGNLVFQEDEGILFQCLKRRDIIDIEDLREEMSEEYYRYIAIDGRLLVPLIGEETVPGVIVLGNHISGQEYSRDDFQFIRRLAGTSGKVLYHFQKDERIRREINRLERQKRFNDELEEIHRDLLKTETLASIGLLVEGFMKKAGIESYTFFLHDPQDNLYHPLFTEREDYCLIDERNTRVDGTVRLISEMEEAVPPLVLSDPDRSPLLAGTFAESQIRKMNSPRFYPALMGNRVSGFIALFLANEKAETDEIDYKMVRLARIMIPLLQNIHSGTFRDVHFMDSIEIVYRRIEEEISRAFRLKVPLTLVLFTIRNYRKLYDLHGSDKISRLIHEFEVTITARLGDSDFSVRYDRHKVIIVLPGKDRKFAVPLASVIRNELVQKMADSEMQLLVSFLTAEFPEDGNSVYELIDSID